VLSALAVAVCSLGLAALGTAAYRRRFRERKGL
jgi:hypothetical protein